MSRPAETSDVKAEIGILSVYNVHFMISGESTEQARDAVFRALFNTQLRAGFTLGAASASIVKTAAMNSECLPAAYLF